MTETLATIEHVSKRFCRNLRRSLWYGFKDLAYEMVAQGNNKTELRPKEFWALRDVSFELKRGDFLAIIGRNGAGKTTILRLLNGLIKPDVGRITTRGQVQALIALGVGFNPILTGRENIYVSASILRIPKSEIDRRFDEIVDFAGIPEFIDSPVQTYSSGMLVRLGFAVAINMEPDILLIDEVLAVGDMGFQQKCWGRLNQLRKQGIGSIVITHNMTTVLQFCDKGILLSEGRMVESGSTQDVVRSYMKIVQADIAKDKDQGQLRIVDDGLYGSTIQGRPEVEELVVKLYETGTNEEAYEISPFEAVDIYFKIKLGIVPRNLLISFIMHREDGLLLTAIANLPDGITIPSSNGYYEGRLKLHHLGLNPGKYAIVLVLHDGEYLYRARVLDFVIKSDLRLKPGIIDIQHSWEFKTK